MTSHENMSPQIKHDIGLGLLVKEQSKSCNDRTIDYVGWRKNKKNQLSISQCKSNVSLEDVFRNALDFYLRKGILKVTLFCFMLIVG
jgi:hypothetical protein